MFASVVFCASLCFPSLHAYAYVTDDLSFVQMHMAKPKDVVDLSTEMALAVANDTCNDPLVHQRAWSELRSGDLSNVSSTSALSCFDQETLEDFGSDVEDAVEFLGQEHPPPPMLHSCVVKPSLLYIGGGHCGSTTLAKLLNQHDELDYGVMKEHSYFKVDKGRRYQTYLGYLEEFRVPCSTKVAMDFPVRLFWQGDPYFRQYNSEWTGLTGKSVKLGLPFVKSVKRLLGNGLKILMMIRDPVDKLNSNSIKVAEYVNFINDTDHHLNTGLDEKVHQSYLMKGRQVCYAEGLKRWMQVFPREQFLFLKSEDFFADPQETLDKVMTYTDVKRKIYPPHQLVYKSGRRRAGGKSSLTQEIRTRYHHLPSSVRCRRELEKLTGLKFDWKGVE